MPMTKEQQQMVLNALSEKIGCPMNVQHPLEAFTAGVKAAVVGIAAFVSIDQDALKESSGAPINNGKRRKALKKGAK